MLTETKDGAIAVIANEISSKQEEAIQQVRTTIPYQMAYFYFMGLDIKKMERDFSGRMEVTFEGPGAMKYRNLYKTSDEKRLLDAFAKMKSIIHGDSQINS